MDEFGALQKDGEEVARTPPFPLAQVRKTFSRNLAQELLPHPAVEEAV